MNKLTILLAATAISLTAEAQRLNFGTPAQQKLQIAEMAVTELYVDSVDADKLVEGGIRGMLKELDPHSSYTLLSLIHI